MGATIDEAVRQPEDGRVTVPGRVVVPLSGHWDTQRAFPAAIWLAAQADAPMLLVSVVIDAAFVDGRRAELDGVADELRARGLEVDTIVRRTDEAGPAIVEEAKRRPASVICMPTHGPGRLAEVAIGTVTRDVVAHAADPVVLVGPKVAAIAAPQRFVAAVDGTPPSARAASTAAQWARSFGLDLELVEVVAERVDERLAAGDLLEGPALHGLATVLRAEGVEPSCEVLHDRDRTDAIVRHLGERRDAWAVVGTHARHGIPWLAQGSVAMQVVHRSPVPVVVVR